MSLLLGGPGSQMAPPTKTPGCRSLQTLPTELLLEITKYIPDFASLNGLLTLLAAHNRGVSFIEDFQKEIFANVIRAGREHELSRIVTAVMTLRNDSTTKQILLGKGAGERKNFVYKYLRSDDRERDGKPHYLQWFSDPIATIRDIWSISHDIDVLVQDFAQTRIVTPSEQPERPPSSTELYRIRRAFWYFQLCYELVHGEEYMTSRAEDDAQSQRTRRFVHYRAHQAGQPCFPNTGWLYGHTGKKLSRTVHYCMHSIPSWPVEDIEAVRFHLSSLINAFQYRRQGKSSLSSWQPALVQRLTKDLDHWREDTENSVDHLLVAELRSDLDRSAIEQWGWGMWDAERLSKRGLKPKSEHTHSRYLSEKAFRECEDAQSTYIDRWVVEKFRVDMRPAEEENRQWEEKAKREEQMRQKKRNLKLWHAVLDKKKATLRKPLSAKRARREAKVLARDSEKDNGTVT